MAVNCWLLALRVRDLVGPRPGTFRRREPDYPFHRPSKTRVVPNLIGGDSKNAHALANPLNSPGALNPGLPAAPVINRPATFHKSATPRPIYAEMSPARTGEDYFAHHKVKLIGRCCSFRRAQWENQVLKMLLLAYFGAETDLKAVGEWSVSGV